MDLLAELQTVQWIAVGALAFVALILGIRLGTWRGLSGHADDPRSAEGHERSKKDRSVL
jgi:hypothetical protein